LECGRCRRGFVGDCFICDQCAAASEQSVSSLAFSLREAIPCASPRLTTQAEVPRSTNKADPGERKEVSVVFADIKGSMELIAERDPEDAQSILDPALALMMDAVHRYDGTVSQVMGDGIMALFGAPLAQEDHAVRACHAALHLQKMIENYATDLRSRLGVDVQVRIGINSGEVVVRGIVTDVRREYTAVGQTAHLAARMEQLARPGTILIAQPTAIAVGNLFESRALGPVPVKGLTEPVNVFELLFAWDSQTASGLAKAKPGGLSSFVGRTIEMSEIGAALDSVREGRGQLVALVGEPGIGKSRLAYEAIKSSHCDGWMTLEGRGLSYGSRTAFLPIASLLRAYLGIQGSDSMNDVRNKAIEGLAALNEDDADTVSAVLSLLDIQQQNPNEAVWIELDPAVRRQKTIDALRTLILKLSTIQPLILLIEDLHWIDIESLSVIHALLEALPNSRILLMVTYRPEYEQSWATRTCCTLIRVDPLTSSVMEAFALELLGNDAALPGLRQKLIERTEGNPFFLEESVRSLAEAGVLLGRRGAYRLAGSIHQMSIPSSVKSVLAARIDRLSREDKAILQAAAVIGKDVPTDVLTLVMGKPSRPIHSDCGVEVLEFDTCVGC
jgi:class 3 adenylate cyclase